MKVFWLSTIVLVVSSSSLGRPGSKRPPLEGLDHSSFESEVPQVVVKRSEEDHSYFVKFYDSDWSKNDLTRESSETSEETESESAERSDETTSTEETSEKSTEDESEKSASKETAESESYGDDEQKPEASASQQNESIEASDASEGTIESSIETNKSISISEESTFITNDVEQTTANPIQETSGQDPTKDQVSTAAPPIEKDERQNNLVEEKSLNGSKNEEIKQTRQTERNPPLDTNNQYWSDDFRRGALGKRYNILNGVENAPYLPPSAAARMHISGIVSHDINEGFQGYETITEPFTRVNPMEIREKVTEEIITSDFHDKTDETQEETSNYFSPHGDIEIRPHNDVHIVSEEISTESEIITENYPVVTGPHNQGYQNVYNHGSQKQEWNHRIGVTETPGQKYGTWRYKEKEVDIENGGDDLRNQFEYSPITRLESTKITSQIVEPTLGSSIERPPIGPSAWPHQPVGPGAEGDNALAHLHLSGRLSEEQGSAFVEVGQQGSTESAQESIEDNNDYINDHSEFVGYHRVKGKKQDKGIIKGAYNDGSGGKIKGTLHHGKSTISGTIFHKPGDGRTGFRGSVHVGIGKLPGPRQNTVDDNLATTGPIFSKDISVERIYHTEETDVMEPVNTISDDADLLNSLKSTTRHQNLKLHPLKNEVISKHENHTLARFPVHSGPAGKKPKGHYKQEKTLLSEKGVGRKPHLGGHKYGQHNYRKDVDSQNFGSELFEDPINDLEKAMIIEPPMMNQKLIKTDQRRYQPRHGYESKYLRDLDIESGTTPWVATYGKERTRETLSPVGNEGLRREKLSVPVMTSYQVESPCPEASITGKMSKQEDTGSLEISGNLPIGPDGKPMAGIYGVMNRDRPNDLRGKIHF